MSDAPPGRKDHWDKLAILLHPVGGLLTALAVASLGLIGSRALDRQQSNDARLRLYSELMSKREESEATLRKEMFQSIIGSFFDKDAASLEVKLLKMELLAQNFHEALDLTPLFLHLRREIGESNEPATVRRGYERRLSDLAREVTRKQMIELEAGGRRFDWTLLISDSLLAGTGSEQLDDVTLALGGIQRRFRVTVMKADTAQRLVHVNLEIETLTDSVVSKGAANARYAVDFDVGFFSSPMIDNTRLSNDQRVAIVLTDLNSAGASLSLVYFPGSRASLREKPYYEEILQKLTDTAGKNP
jgi:aspartate 1-decarboxylase